MSLWMKFTQMKKPYPPISIIILNVSLDEIHSNEEAISSNQYEYILNDYRRNLPLLEREALEELSEEVIKKKTPCTDSKEDLKKIIDEKLKAENDEYYKDYGIKIESHVSSIENRISRFKHRKQLEPFCSKNQDLYFKCKRGFKLQKCTGG